MDRETSPNAAAVGGSELGITVDTTIQPERSHDERNAAEWFEQAVTSEGPAYIEARGHLLAYFDRTKPLLESERRSPDPHRALVAAAILGHVRHADAYAQARSRLPSNEPRATQDIIGRYHPGELAGWIAALGDPIDPWLYETLLKSRDHGGQSKHGFGRGPDGRDVIELAIQVRNNPVFLPLFLELAQDRTAALDSRQSAIVIVAGIGGDVERTRLVALLRDGSEPDETRVEAATQLAASRDLRPPSLRIGLEAVLLAEGTSDTLRGVVVDALRTLGDPDSAPALNLALDRRPNHEITGRLCRALGSLGNAKSVRHLRAALPTIPDRDARQSCTDELHLLRDRLHHAPPDDPR